MVENGETARDPLTVLAPEDLVSLLGISKDELDCAGIKLTLGEVYYLNGRGYLGAEERILPEYHAIEPQNGKYVLDPGPYLVKYNEYIRIPNGYMGLAVQRSSLLRMGVSLYTAVWDPGYHGRGSGLLVVHNPNGVVLEKNVQIAQLVVLRMSRETRYTYKGLYLGEK